MNRTARNVGAFLVALLLTVTCAMYPPKAYGEAFALMYECNQEEFGTYQLAFNAGGTGVVLYSSGAHAMLWSLSEDQKLAYLTRANPYGPWNSIIDLDTKAIVTVDPTTFDIRKGQCELTDVL